VKQNIFYTAYGGAGQVSGSKHLFTFDSPGSHYGLLVDCGLDHENPVSDNQLRSIAAQTDFVIITHAHLDHFGDLERLLSFKPSIKIYCTYGTYYIIKKTTTANINGKWTSVYKKYEQNFFVQPYHKQFYINNHIRCQFFNAGHIPGSAMAALELTLKNGYLYRVFCTGDIGPEQDIPLLLTHDQDLPAEVDLMLCECTYGMDEREEESNLLEMVQYAKENKKRIICAAFSVMRTQWVLWDLLKLLMDKKTSDLNIGILASPHSDNIKLNNYIGWWLAGDYRIQEHLPELGHFPVEFIDPACAWLCQGANHGSGRMRVIKKVNPQKLVLVHGDTGNLNAVKEECQRVLPGLEVVIGKKRN
jgi:Cft2 family RNA processing exonuclease